MPLYVHTGFDEWYGWGYDLGELERIAERHPEIPLVLCHCAFPRLEWAAEMARRHPQVWLDTTNVFGSIELAPEPARAGLLRQGRGPLRRRAGPDLLRHRLPGGDGVARAAARPGPPAHEREQMAANAARFVNEAFGLDLDPYRERLARAMKQRKPRIT